MEQVQEVSQLIWQALKDSNQKDLKKYVHPDAVFVHMGVTLSRDGEIEIIESKGIILKEIVFEEQTQHSFDDVSILLNKIKLTAIVNGNEVVNPFVVTEVYSNKGNQVQLISLSYTRINY
ncbi:nuclear transport factor 2 family protein [Enterococcus sp. HY326]|uniref:nuclear transport factor 2 family protein n=1 Tax=Enterococcus sp. HY326 TaxID=2971265 RepID=UPI00224045B4|nr:nuclear transport factor 2 family protein [Enterococcus sp. HY326]